MPLIKIQAVRAHSSGLPKDVAVNTFHFLGSNDPTNLGPLVTDVLHFYNTAPAGAPTNPDTGSGYKLGDFLARHMRAITVKAYDVGGTPPHPPLVETIPDDPTAGRGDLLDLPAEVAICMSVQAPRIGGQVQARRRGRIYVGPLNTLAAIFTNNTVPRPSAAVTGAIQRGAVALKAAAAGHGYTWVVHSPTSNQQNAITDGWVDNAFDTIRGRGEAPTVRNAFTI